MGVANNFDFFNNFDFLNDAVEKLADAQALVDLAKEEILLLIEQHNLMRQEIFVQALKKKKLGWCSMCKSFVDSNELTLVLTHGKRYEEHGYQDSYYGFNPFRKIYRVCERCKENLLSKDGYCGPYDHQAKDQSSFHARIIQDDEIEKKDIPPLYPEIGEATEARWNIPPLIQIIDETNRLKRIGYRKNDRLIPVPAFDNIIIT